MQPVIHPASDNQLQQMTRDLPQSLLLAGEKGMWLLTVAKNIAGRELAAVLVPQDKKEQPDSESGTITVEMIRRLYDQTRAKHTSRQIIIIDNADQMSRGAQNAFLKLLEEPAQHVHFILTSHNPGNLLATIASRVQKITLQPITTEQTTAFLQRLGITDTKRLAQLQYIAAGLPAELQRLVDDESYFETRAEIVTDARDFLMADTYKKITIIQKYQSDRERVLQLLDSVMTVARRSLSAKPQQSLVSQLANLLAVRERIATNHNIRLQLMQFVL